MVNGQSPAPAARPAAMLIFFIVPLLSSGEPDEVVTRPLGQMQGAILATDQ